MSKNGGSGSDKGDKGKTWTEKVTDQRKQESDQRDNQDRRKSQ